MANGNGQSFHAATAEGPYKSAHISGEQELIIPSPRHVSSLSELTDEELKVSFVAYQDRLKRLEILPHIQHAMLFMNCRLTAGASLSHIHSQVMGSPLISDHLLGRNQRNQASVQTHGVTLVGSLMEWECNQQQRVVFESDNFCVYCPFASRFPFQTWIVPKHHQQRFQECPGEMRDELAGLCRQVVARLENLLDEPGYNMLLHVAPFSLAENDHWYIEIFPRLTRAAGFEWGTDIWINPVAPETAARADPSLSRFRAAATSFVR